MFDSVVYYALFPVAPFDIQLDQSEIVVSAMKEGELRDAASLTKA